MGCRSRTTWLRVLQLLAAMDRPHPCLSVVCLYVRYRPIYRIEGSRKTGSPRAETFRLYRLTYGLACSADMVTFLPGLLFRCGVYPRWAVFPAGTLVHLDGGERVAQFRCGSGVKGVKAVKVRRPSIYQVAHKHCRDSPPARRTTNSIVLADIWR